MAQISKARICQCCCISQLLVPLDQRGMCLIAQISKARADVSVSERDLLAVPKGPRTEACLRNNCVVGVQYLEAWLGGLGCVPLYNLMEDAATAEICRTQVRRLFYGILCLTAEICRAQVRRIYLWNTIFTAQICSTQIRGPFSRKTIFTEVEHLVCLR